MFQEFTVLNKIILFFKRECCKCVHKKDKDNSGEFDGTISESSKSDDTMSKSTKRVRKSTSRFSIDSMEIKTNKRKKSQNSKKAKKMQKKSITNKKEENSSLSLIEKTKNVEFSNKQKEEECIYLEDEEYELINEKIPNSTLSSNNKFNIAKKINKMSCPNDLNESVNSSACQLIGKKRKLSAQSSPSETVNGEYFSSSNSISTKKTSPKISLSCSSIIATKSFDQIPDKSEKNVKKAKTLDLV